MSGPLGPDFWEEDGNLEGSWIAEDDERDDCGQGWGCRDGNDKLMIILKSRNNL